MYLYQRKDDKKAAKTPQLIQNKMPLEKLVVKNQVNLKIDRDLYAIISLATLDYYLSQFNYRMHN